MVGSSIRHDKLFVRVKNKDLLSIRKHERLDDLSILVSTPSAKQILYLDVDETVSVQIPLNPKMRKNKQEYVTKEFEVKGKRALIDKYSGMAHRALLLVHSL